MRRLAIGLLFAVATHACSCAENGPPCEAAWKASVVFAGTVVDLTRDVRVPDGTLAVHVTFDVTEPFIGMEGRGKRVEIRTGVYSAQCGYPFQRAADYVVYAYERNGTLIANICSRTARADRAAADLAYLRGLRTAGPTGSIFGFAGGPGREGHFDAALQVWVPPGIDGVTITLTGMGKTLEKVTGSDGAFRFDGLAPGKYEMSAAKPGYLQQGGPMPREVHAGGCAYAWRILTR